MFPDAKISHSEFMGSFVWIFTSSLISLLECHFQIVFLSSAPCLAGGQNTLHSGSWRGKGLRRSFWRHVAVLELKTNNVENKMRNCAWEVPNNDPENTWARLNRVSVFGYEKARYRCHPCAPATQVHGSFTCNNTELHLANPDTAKNALVFLEET